MKMCGIVASLVSVALIGNDYGARAESSGIMLGAFLPGNPDLGELIRAFDENTGRTHVLVAHVAPFSFNYCDWPYFLEQIRDAGKIPVISWSQSNNGEPDPAFSNRSFLDGRHDADIAAMARCCADYADTIYMRWSSEMNISASSAWPGHSWNNRSAQGFIDMWRYVHGKFKDAGADNLVWVWSPNYMGAAEGRSTYSNYNNLYPGDDYVDVVGLSGLNYGDHPTSGPGFSVTVQWLYIPILRDLMAGSYNAVSGIARGLRDLARLSGAKPQGLFEFGCVESRSSLRSAAVSDIPKEDWIKQAYNAIAHMDEFSFVRLVVWYNQIDARPPVSSDFRVARNPGNGEPAVPSSVTQAYREATSDPIFVGRPLSLEEMAPGGYYRAPSTVTPAGYPQHELWPGVRPGGAIRRGETLSAAYFLWPPVDQNPEKRRCDAYLAANIPGGGWYSFVPPSRWVAFNPRAGPPPAAVRDLEVDGEVRGIAFIMTLGAGLPRGLYTIYSILVAPGADPRRQGPDLNSVGFSLE